MGKNKKRKLSPPPIEQLSPEIRGRLELAVLDGFSESDFHSASIEAVGTKAAVSFRTIYKYYGSKEGLLFSFVDKWMNELSERMLDHLQGIQDLKEKMRKVFWVSLDYYERNPKVGKIVFLTVPLKTWMADSTYKQSNLTDIFLSVVKHGQEEQIINPNVRAGLILDVIWGIIHRVFTMWIYRGDEETMTSRTNELFDMLWRAISNPSKYYAVSQTITEKDEIPV